MIVVDSSVWIDVIRNVDSAQTRKFMEIRPNRDIIVADLVLFEILQGARDDYAARRIETELREFDLRPILTPQAAIMAATNFRRLRSLGITIRKSNDLIIGTYCIEHSHRLLHNDRDFKPMVEHLGLVEY